MAHGGIHNLVLRIYDCQQSICGRMRADDHIWGLTPVTQNEWAGGAILDPNDGKIYQLCATTIQTAHCMLESSKASRCLVRSRF